MAFTSDRATRGGNFDIFTMRANSRESRNNRPSNLTKHFRGHCLWPNWSPNGKQIVFQRLFKREDRQFSGIYKMNSDGSHKVKLALIASIRGFYSNPAWSPNGRWIVFEREDGIGLMRADGGHKGFLSHRFGDGAPDWQPLR